MSFKLLAIRPLKGCNPKFLKNLEENQIYQFYNDYEFQDGERKKIKDFSKYNEVKKVKVNKSIPENLYGNKISVSAIVGKNGTGKSALIELLYAGLFNLSVYEKIFQKKIGKSKFKNDDVIKSRKDIEEKLDEISKGDKLGLIDLNDLLENIIKYNSSLVSKEEKYKIPIDVEFDRLLKLAEDEEYFTDEEFKQIDKLSKNLLAENYSNKSERIIELKNNINIVVQDIKIEIFFDINENQNKSLFCIKIDNSSIEIFKFKTKDKSFTKPTLISSLEKKSLLKENFFYSLAINYSFYALNSNELGLWLKSIFHKNDSYQMPIVLNPMRTNGVVDVNIENELTKSRLLYNIFYPLIIDKKEKTNSINGKIPLYINIKVNHYKLFESIIKDSVSTKVVTFVYLRKYKSYIDIIRKVFSIDNIYVENEIQNVCYQYILNKILNIVSYYKTYYESDFFLIIEGDKDEKFEELLEYILENDNSHITLKLRQAVNFLKYYKKFIPNIENSKFLLSEFKIDIKEYSNSINEILKNSDNDFSEYLLPSFFEFDIFFEDKSNFLQLSSGEKQLIYGTNTILYHILNINSVFRNNSEELNKYKYINMIYDEIELYYHPDLQRQFLNYLLKEIDKLDLSNIKGINLLFITHSPFVISDIPKQNILFLGIDNKTKKANSKKYEGENTFGANIHEMLTNGFFMESTKGGFAISKIEEILNFYQKVINLTDLNKKQLLEEYDKKKEYFFEVIEMIGESYVKNVLKNHFIEIQDKLNILDLKALKKKEQELERELRSVRKRLNND